MACSCHACRRAARAAVLRSPSIRQLGLQVKLTYFFSLLWLLSTDFFLSFLCLSYRVFRDFLCNLLSLINCSWSSPNDSCKIVLLSFLIFSWLALNILLSFCYKSTGRAAGRHYYYSLFCQIFLGRVKNNFSVSFAVHALIEINRHYQVPVALKCQHFLCQIFYYFTVWVTNSLHFYCRYYIDRSL